MARKQNQHKELIQDLQAQGWNVYYHIIIITNSGYILHNTSDTTGLSSLGIPEHTITPLLQKLHKHSVKLAWQIISMRRRLENDPKHCHSNTLNPPEPP